MAFVTGAAGAIGQAIARRLADNGATLVIAEINQEGAERVEARLPKALVCRVDISDEAFR